MVHPLKEQTNVIYLVKSNCFFCGGKKKKRTGQITKVINMGSHYEYNVSTHLKPVHQIDIYQVK